MMVSRMMVFYEDGLLVLFMTPSILSRVLDPPLLSFPLLSLLLALHP